MAPLEQVHATSTAFWTTCGSAASTTSRGMVRLLDRPAPEARPEFVGHGPDLDSRMVSMAAQPRMGAQTDDERLLLDVRRRCWRWHLSRALGPAAGQVTAVRILNNHALPLFEDDGVYVQAILSDNEPEYCGRPDNHPLRALPQLEEIEHRTTKVGRAQSIGYIDRDRKHVPFRHSEVRQESLSSRAQVGDLLGRMVAFHRLVLTGTGRGG